MYVSLIVMMLIKKLDMYVLKKFLQLFVGSFFVCLFIFMMQFTWLYIDDLVGKGLTFDVLSQFFFYSSITLVPTSLPLAVLLASLITFGNMGESLELLSMKAAGVSLLRVMAPMIVFCTMLTATSFVFQNKLAPESWVKLRTLLISMRQTSPAVEIPEGVFYSGVPNVNLYVQHKVQETGMLYQVIIYKTDQGFDRAQIVLADSARLEMSADKQHMTLDLWSGEQFENLQGGNLEALGSVPYDRETFGYKRFIIDFDANFNMMDTDLLRNMAQAKNMWQIDHDIDSIQSALDSMGRSAYEETLASRLKLADCSARDRKQASQQARKLKDGFDALMARATEVQRMQAQRSTAMAVQQLKNDYEWRKDMSNDTLRMLRTHKIEWHQKMALSLACLLFFFIGAPLGAVIGKGGLGMSAVVSVIIFILYYIVNASSSKMARQGEIPIWIGLWASTMVMLPTGTWLTYRAQLDRMSINLNSVWNTIKNLPIWHLSKRRSKTSDRAEWS